MRPGALILALSLTAPGAASGGPDAAADPELVRQVDEIEARLDRLEALTPTGRLAETESCPRPTRLTLPCRCATRWPSRTPRASFTRTSSPRTSSWRKSGSASPTGATPFSTWSRSPTSVSGNSRTRRPTATSSFPNMLMRRSVLQ